MSVAASADDFGPDHEESLVFDLSYIGSVDRLPETGPAGARFELGRGIEKGQVAADALVDAVFLIVPVLAAESAFGALLTRDFELLRCELRFPFGFRFFHF